jgi:hypothetical protein
MASMKHIKRLHENLEQNVSWYRKWHENRGHRAVHYAILFLSLVFALGMIISSSQTFAAPTTYYVATNGNDSNPGTQTQPWKTVVKACNTVTTAGDTIHIGTGTFTGTQQCNLSPGVNLEGEGKNNTIVKITITGNLNSATSTAAINMESPNGTNGNQSISNLTLDGGNGTTGNASGTWIGVYNQGRSNVSIHDTIIKNFHFYGAVFQGNTLDGQTAHTWTDGPYATGNRFYNNDASNCAGVLAEIQGGSGCLGLGWQIGMDIHHNSIINDARPLGKNGWPIKFWANGYLKGLKIHDNTLKRSPYNNNQAFGGNGEWDFAIEFFNVQGLELYNNYIQGSVDINYTYKGTYPYGLWAYNNILNHATPNYPHPESGFILEFKAEHVIIENNTFNNKFVGISYNTRGPNNNGGENTYACNYGGSTGGCSGIINNVIRNNVFSNVYAAYPGSTNGPFGLPGGIITQSEGTDDVQMDGMHIYNNVFSATTVGNGAYNGLDFGGMGGGASVKNVYIRNNIFQNFRSNPIVKQSGGTQSNIQITNNDFYNNTPNDVSWTGATQANNQTINPLFVSGTDFHLQATSPLIDDGFTPLALPSYAQPVPFNPSAPDLGAYETGSSAPDTTPPTVSSTNPANNATGIAVGSDVLVTFSEPLSSASVTTTTASIAGVTSAVTLAGSIVTINPSANLAPSTTYTVTLMGGTSGIKDLANNALASNYTFSFTTAAPANIPPTANAGAPQTITLPTNTVNLSGSLSNDPDGTIVSYAWVKQSGPAAGTIVSPASVNTVVNNLTLVGSYVYKLTVTDNQGATGTATVTITVNNGADTTPPTVSITSPTNGQTVSLMRTITVNASDNIGVDHVDFYRGGTILIGSSGVAPYSFNWNTTTVPNGTYSLTAKAYDVANNSATSTPVSVNVLNTVDPGPDTTPPTVSITSPTSGQTVSSVATVKANASDNIGVTKVEFYRSGSTTPIATDTSSPYEITWDTTTVANGSYSLTAKAYDGAIPTPNSTVSTAVSITVSNIPTTGGNFTTWNPNDKGNNIMLSNGNLTEKDNGYKGLVRAKIGKSSGKWYWEIKIDDRGANQDLNFYPGVANLSAPKENFVGYNKNGWGYWGAYGDKRNGSIKPYGPTFDEGDVIGVALDMDAKKLKFYKNCTDLGVAFSGLSGTLYPAAGQFGGDVKVTANFGATAFACPVPAGYNPGVN